MKKLFLIISIIFIFLSFYITIKNNIGSNKIKSNDKVDKLKLDSDSIEKDIISLRKYYNNDDIVAIIEIPGVFREPVVQASDNDYYLTHNYYKEEDKSGAIFLDYRLDLENYKKLLIYGHNSTKKILPFKSLTYYADKSYYDAHPTIYLYTLNGIFQFHIFATYKESDEYDYVNLNNYDGSYLEHIKKLKSKSDYNIDVNLTEGTKVIILQTCNYTANKTDGFRLVMGKYDS